MLSVRKKKFSMLYKKVVFVCFLSFVIIILVARQERRLDCCSYLVSDLYVVTLRALKKTSGLLGTVSDAKVVCVHLPRN